MEHGRRVVICGVESTSLIILGSAAEPYERHWVVDRDEFEFVNQLRQGVNLSNPGQRGERRTLGNCRPGSGFPSRAHSSRRSESFFSNEIISRVGRYSVQERRALRRTGQSAQGILEGCLCKVKFERKVTYGQQRRLS